MNKKLLHIGSGHHFHSRALAAACAAVLALTPLFSLVLLVENAGATEGNERNRQQNSWKRKKRIHQHNVDEAIDASAVVSGERADDQS